MQSQSTPVIPPIAPQGESLARLHESHPLLKSPKEDLHALALQDLCVLLSRDDFNDRTTRATITEFMNKASEEEVLNAFNQLFMDEDNAYFVTEEMLITIIKHLYSIRHKDDEAQLLQTLFLQYKIYYSPAYTNCRSSINSFKGHYKLTLSENIFRHAIGLNAGLGSGSVIYGIATAILLTPFVMAVAGAASIFACLTIMNYFLAAYTDEDDELARELSDHENEVRILANLEAEKRLVCYRLLIQTRKALQPNPSILDQIKFKKFSDCLNHFYKTSGMADLTEMDAIIDDADNFSPSVSTAEQVSKGRKRDTNSIYSRLFHSKYWGPVLSFFGATGTLFGVTKTILTVAAVTTLAGSTVLLPVVVAAAAILVSGTFAFKHWRFNKKSESRKDKLSDFRDQQFENLKIKSDKLQHLISQLERNLEQVEGKFYELELQKNNPKNAATISNHMQRSAAAAPQVGHAEALRKMGTFTTNDDEFKPTPVSNTLLPSFSPGSGQV